MKALLCTELGAFDALAVQDVPSPTPGAGQVLVDVKASSVNFPDALMVKGLYQVKPPLPFSPGAEIAGVVARTGDGVANFEPGDRVAGLCGWGGFAEEALVPATQLIPLPPEMDFDLAAAVGLTYGTSLHALQDCARLQAGETLLVLGAGGGVGSAAVELGKLMGARVIAAASSDDKLALCARLGADETVHYGREDLRERLKAVAGPSGVDVVFDPVGGPFSETALRATGWRGRVLVIGIASGEIPRIPLNLALLKERAILGVYLGDWARQDPAGHARNVALLMKWLTEGRLRPAISERVPLAGAPGALARIYGRQVTGTVVVLPAA